MKTILNIASVAAAVGLAASAQAQTTLFSTDFSNHTFGADNLAETDGWTTIASAGVQGIKSNGGDLYGYLGEAAPDFNFDQVYSPSTPYDPVAAGNPIVNISMDLAIFDSTNPFDQDTFYLEIYNQNFDVLGSIAFDNTSQGILRGDGLGLNNTDFVPLFAHDTFEELDISINFAANTWSASYGSDSLFTNAEFNADGSALNYDSIGFTWEVTDLNFPGDNYVGFDNIDVEANVVPEPSTYALLAGVVCLGGVLLRRRK